MACRPEDGGQFPLVAIAQIAVIDGSADALCQLPERADRRHDGAIGLALGWRRSVEDEHVVRRMGERERAVGAGQTS